MMPCRAAQNTRTVDTGFQQPAASCARFRNTFGPRLIAYVPAAAWREYVFGYTILNDVSARDFQMATSQWMMGKTFDTFAPFGPCIEVGGTRGPRTVEGFVNGERRQQGHTSNLIFPIEFLIEYITFVMTLEPGDIISTGTPSGVGPIEPGDVVSVVVEGVGELSNPVRAEH